MRNKKLFDILSVVMSIVMMLSSCRTDTATADEITTEETAIISASATDSAAAANPDEPGEFMTPRLLYMGQASIPVFEIGDGKQVGNVLTCIKDAYETAEKL